jgi:hypothetical protein
MFPKPLRLCGQNLSVSGKSNRIKPGKAQEIIFTALFPFSRWHFSARVLLPKPAIVL